MKIAYIIVILYVISSCANTKEMTMQNDGTTSCQVVEKHFVKKDGKEMESTDLYLRCSIQDYFIKICESSVSREELEKYINKGITVKMSIEEGLWDHCPGDPMVQSRSGQYVIIKSIE